jgi:phage-related protein
MSDFNEQPRSSAQTRREPRVLVARFGDGYEQRAAGGINANPQIWTLEFAGTRAEIDTIETFLVTKAGITAFTWTPSGGSEIKVVCREWQRTHMAGSVSQLSATFEQVFE